jgi:hypothetical protein
MLLWMAGSEPGHDESARVRFSDTLLRGNNTVESSRGACPERNGFNCFSRINRLYIRLRGWKCWVMFLLLAAFDDPGMTALHLK